MIKITLKTMPPALNAMYRRGPGSFYKADSAKQAQVAIQWEMRAQYRGKPLKGPVGLSVSLHWGDMRRHDIDGPLKALLDCGNDLLYEDDSQIRQLKVSKSFDKENPRVEIELVSLGV